MEKMLNTLIIIFFIIQNVKCWNLTSIGFDNSKVLVKHVTIIKNKAYLSIPRQFDNQKVSLVESSWPETAHSVLNVLQIYPNKETKITESCRNLQSVISSDVDVLGRLIILDSGLGSCSPKIIIYDVNHHKMMIDSELHGVNGSSLHSIIVDHTGGHRAYVGDIDHQGLIIYNVRDHHWWFVKLSPPPEFVEYRPEEKIIEPQQLTLSKFKPLLYLTSDRTNNIFSINAAALRVVPMPHAGLTENINHESSRFEVKLEGEKIGPSKGLICDKKGGLYYYVPRDYLMVRWDTHHPIVAENHEILSQSETVIPNVEQIFLDSHQHLWLLLGLANQEGNHCIPLLKPNTV